MAHPSVGTMLEAYTKSMNTDCDIKDRAHGLQNDLEKSSKENKGSWVP